MEVRQHLFSVACTGGAPSVRLTFPSNKVPNGGSTMCQGDRRDVEAKKHIHRTTERSIALYFWEAVILSQQRNTNKLAAVPNDSFFFWENLLGDPS